MTTTVTQTLGIELQQYSHHRRDSHASQQTTKSGGIVNESAGIVLGRGSIDHRGGQEPELESEAETAAAGEIWHTPRRNIYRTFACFFSLFTMGLNDAAYGALIPYLEPYYKLSYTVVSLIFLSPFVGYVFAALCNAPVHNRFGQRGVAMIAPTCRIIAYVVFSQHPPYAVLVVMYLINGFGIGLADAAWNAYIGDMQDANQLLGFLHGFYGLGATISPLIVASMVVKGGLGWYSFYYFMAALAVADLTASLTAFWSMSGAVFRRSVQASTHEAGVGAGGSGNLMKQALFKRPAARVTWLCAIFLLGYVGMEVSLGGWIVEFMINVRHKGSYPSSIAATGFWAGFTVGRMTLGFVTPRLGETLAIALYLPIAMVFELIFWLVPQFYVSAVAVAFQGFFMGPLFPAGIVAMTKLLPKYLHVTAIGFAAAFAGTGAAIFPFAVGAIAQRKGVQVLQPIILVLMAVLWLLWMGLPRVGKKRD